MTFSHFAYLLISDPLEAAKAMLEVADIICDNPIGFFVFVGLGLLCYLVGVFIGWVVFGSKKERLISVEEDALNGRR